MAAQLAITIRAFDKTARAFSLARKGLMGVSGALVNVKTALVGVVGAAGFGALIKQGLAAGDSLAKTADKIGVTTEALAGMQHAAELTGVSTETMNMALQRFTRRASEAAIGTGEAKGALIELGLNAKELNKLPLDQQMEKVADAMQGLETQSDRVRIAMKLFDSEGVALVNTLGGGSEALREMIDEAEHLGLALSRTDTAQIEAANDAFTRAKGVLTGLSNQLAVSFAPILQLIADTFRQSALDSADFGNTGQRVADAIVGAFAKVQGALHGVKMFILQLRIGFIQLGRYIASSLAPALQAIIDIYNRIAGFLGKPLIENPIQQFADEAKESVTTLKNELLAMQEIDPAANILEAYEAIKVKSRETAEQIAADKLAQVNKDKESEANKTQWQLYQDELTAKSTKARNEFEALSASDKTKHVLGQLQTLTAGSQKQSKKLFALQKSAAIANAIVQTIEASVIAFKAGGGFPMGIPMAALTVAQGMAKVSAIKSQSFDGGGFTGSGSRTGGVDGKGGFHAILHPQETVIDHTKPNIPNIASKLPSFEGGGYTGGAMPATNNSVTNNIDNSTNTTSSTNRNEKTEQQVIVNQTINVTTGVQGTVRAEIANLMPQISEAAQNAVLEARMRGGAYSKQLMGR